MSLDDKILSVLLKDFSEEETNEELLRSIDMTPEQFFYRIWNRVISEPSTRETEKPKRVRGFFQEELHEVTCNLNKEKQERLYEMFQVGFLQIAHHRRRSVEIKESDKDQAVIKEERSSLITERHETTIVKKYRL